MERTETLRLVVYKGKTDVKRRVGVAVTVLDINREPTVLALYNMQGLRVDGNYLEFVAIVPQVSIGVATRDLYKAWKYMLSARLSEDDFLSETVAIGKSNYELAFTYKVLDLIAPVMYTVAKETDLYIGYTIISDNGSKIYTNTGDLVDKSVVTSAEVPAIRNLGKYTAYALKRIGVMSQSMVDESTKNWEFCKSNVLTEYAKMCVEVGGDIENV